jgi:hypothetical protein
MWLDRLSGHSTPGTTPSASPPPPNRSYTAPRRTGSHLGPPSVRPNFNPRSSSLSIHSNDSSTSLLASSRRLNGSGLKQSVTAEESTNPSRVLNELLGVEIQDQPDVSKQDGVNGERITDDDFASEIDFEGLSLRDFVGRKGPEEHVDTTQTIEECMLFST